MNMYEAVGIAWIVFTTSLATVAILYFSYVGVKHFMKSVDQIESAKIKATTPFRGVERN